MSEAAIMDDASAILSAATSSDASSSSQSAPAATQQTDDLNPADESQDGAASPSTEETTEDGEGKSGEGAGDQQKVPTTQQIRAALKAFRDGSPEHSQAAKILNDSYGRAEAYKAVIPTVEEARNIKTQLDAIGGLDGLAELQSERASFQATDEAITNGDPEVLDALIEDAPEGFKKLAPHYLNKLQKLDPQAFHNTVQPHLVNALVDANFPQVVNYLLSQLNDKPQLKQTVQSMLEWFNEQKSAADKENTNLTSPEQEKLAQGWKQLQTERRQELQTAIDNAVGPHVRQTLGTALKPFSEHLVEMPPAQRNLIAGEAIRRLAAALDGDKAYKSQLETMYGAKKPDRAKIIDFNNRKVNALAPRIIESVVSDFKLRPNGKPGPKPGAQRTAPKTETKTENTAITTIQVAPKDSEIDWSHEHMNEEAYIRGRAVLTPEAAKRRGLTSRYVGWKK